MSSEPVTWPDLRGRLSESDRERSLVTGVNGWPMAQQSRPPIIVGASKPAAWYAVVCLKHDIPKRAAD